MAQFAPVSLRAAAAGIALAAAPRPIAQGTIVDADALPRITVTENLRIGDAADPRTGFNAILAIDVDRDGQVYVYDTQAREIRVFARDGRPVRTIGRRGSGPGEFGSVSHLGVLGDSVWTYEFAARRLNIFRRSGAVVASRTIAAENPVVGIQGGGVAYVAPRTLQRDGTMLSHIDFTLLGTDPMAARMSAARGVTGQIGANDTVMLPRVRFPAAGTRLDTVGWEPLPPDDGPPPSPPPVTRGPDGRPRSGEYVVVNGVTLTVPSPPGDALWRVTLSNGSAVANRRRAPNTQPAEFSVTRYDLSGKPMHRLRFRYRPSRYEGAVLDTIAMRPVSRSNAPSDAAFKAMRAALKFPAFQSPIYSIWEANDASLWIRREDDAGATMRWIVIERTGAVRGVVHVPRSARPMWARGDTLIAVDTDADGVPSVVRYLTRLAR